MQFCSSAAINVIFPIPSFMKGITESRASIKRGSVRQCVRDQEKDTEGRFFFHLTYHLRDPTSKYLRRQWRQYLLHQPWESPLWNLKNKHKIAIDINLMCVAYSRPKILVISSSTVRSIFSMGPLSPPIWSIDWGHVIFRMTYMHSDSFIYEGHHGIARVY